MTTCSMALCNLTTAHSEIVKCFLSKLILQEVKSIADLGSPRVLVCSDPMDSSSLDWMSGTSANHLTREIMPHAMPN